MSSATRREVVLLVLLFLLVATLVVWWVFGDQSTRSFGGGGSAGIRGKSSPVTISGDVSRAIAPGTVAPLNLSIDNSNDVDVAIDQVTVKVAAVNAPRADIDHPCSAADFEVRQLSKVVVLRIAGNASEDLRGLGVAPGDWPSVGMLDRPVNQDGCKGALLTLNYEARGVEVR